MEHILAERTLKIEVDGLPDATLRVVVGVPVMVTNENYRTDIELHGPEPGSVLERYSLGADAWQSVTNAFWAVPVMVHTRCNSNARITHDGEEDWHGLRAPLPLP
jgi:hypothetical protein